MSADSHNTGDRRVLIDEVYLAQWVLHGFQDFTRYLERQAAFDQYLRDKEQNHDRKD